MRNLELRMRDQLRTPYRDAAGNAYTMHREAHRIAKLIEL